MIVEFSCHSNGFLCQFHILSSAVGASNSLSLRTLFEGTASKSDHCTCKMQVSVHCLFGRFCHGTSSRSRYDYETIRTYVPGCVASGITRYLFTYVGFTFSFVVSPFLSVSAHISLPVFQCKSNNLMIQ